MKLSHLVPTAALSGLLCISVHADTTSDLIVHFALDEVSGTTAVESVAGRDGTLVDAPTWTTPGLQFNGTSQYVTTPNDTGNGITNRLTLSAWVRVDTFRQWDGIITKGTSQAAYTMGIWNDGSLVLGANSFSPTGGVGGGFTPWVSTAKLTAGQWHHVAVTYDGSHVRIYLDGAKDSEHAALIVFGSVAEPLILGCDLPGGIEYLDGTIRNARVYSRALSDSDIAELHTHFGADYVGLWVGEARLDQVRNIASNAYEPTPVAFSEHVIMHIDSVGQPRFLKEATLMRTRDADAEVVVLSDTTNLSNYDGVVRRGGKLVGQRFSSSTFPMQGDSLELNVQGTWLWGTASLAADHPTNPFRHKFHPDLALGRSTHQHRWMNFAADNGPADNLLIGLLYEDVDGLHTSQLSTYGELRLTRVSTSGRLNN